VELSDEFTVSLPVDRAFAVLTDVERIAPCLPGAELQEIDGDEYRGVVKVKVGPITAQYKGVAHFLERDPTTRRVVLRAEGRDTRGQGNASATVTATMEPVGEGTRVSVVTDLTITGKVAQFGRGVLAEVSSKLLGQFVECLEATVAADAPESGESASARSASGESASARSASGGSVSARSASGGSASARSASGRSAAAASASGGSAAAGSGSAGSAASRAAAPAGGGGATPDPEQGGGASDEVGEPGEVGEAPAAEVATEPAAATEPAGPDSGSSRRVLTPRPAEPVDLFEVAGRSLLKRVAPAALLAAVVALALSWYRRASRRRA
jgi:carbon monoxide dehydrogenase subunit G